MTGPQFARLKRILIETLTAAADAPREFGVVHSPGGSPRFVLLHDGGHYGTVYAHEDHSTFSFRADVVACIKRRPDI